ncbi:hypothetical protein BP5796_01565 [Coleophoma crateriformis]|uniref:CCCH zinc finger and RRM domain-containing protein n=1 Tax=Coleophoma crateriformis TaxID=565419 RepID=A0A3D8T165_9HELO|nr:hypothetical protein BP5796_01565 [Coleophoma crateriformis]
MLFSEEDAPELKKWIVKRLENTSDADADVLADYVLALLRHDGDVATVRRLCEEEIPDFLKEGRAGTIQESEPKTSLTDLNPPDSSVFVQDVFDAIQFKSYLPGAPPPPRRQPSGAMPPTFGGSGMPGAPMGPQNGSRKRTYNDRGDGDAQDRGLMAGGDPRAYKQPRRGRGGFGNDFGSTRGGHAGGRPSSSMNFQQGPGAPFQGMPQMPSPPPGMPPLDPNNPMAAIMAMQAMGFAVPGMPGFPPASASSSPPVVKKQRCRDYDTKGFCARGNACMFEHGNDSIYVPPGTKNDEYDPNNAAIDEVNPYNDQFITSDYDNSGRGRGRGRGRGGQRGDRGGNNSRRGGRAEFSSDRPSLDKSNTTIVIEQIPEEKFSEEAVREFFTEFGNITEVSMQPYKRLALVKFEDWDSAQKAYKSPKVIFDNRFVKVYWFKNPESLPHPSGGSGTNGYGASGPAPARETSEPQIDIEEFTRKQQEVQKAHEEKQKKILEMESARKELEKRQEELLKNQAEEKRKLMERIAAKSGGAGSPAPKKEDGSPAPSEGKSLSQTEALKAQLAALEAEAQSLGIDTSMTDDSSWGGRGRGRGRGGYRGRGTFVPRGARGGYRGRGGAPFAGGPNPYKLDNRPKKIALTGVDFTSSANDESLRQYLLGVGEYADIETTPERTSITFKDRFTAEKFMYGTPGCEIPSVGKVDMTWVQTPLPPVSLNNTTSASSTFSAPAGAKTQYPTKNDADADTAMDEGDAMASSPAGNGPGNGGSYNSGAAAMKEENLDYDVADDNDWGPQ